MIMLSNTLLKKNCYRNFFHKNLFIKGINIENSTTYLKKRCYRISKYLFLNTEIFNLYYRIICIQNFIIEFVL